MKMFITGPGRRSNNDYNDNANVQDLDDTFKGEEDQFELKDANEDVAEMVKAVNDSLHQVADLIVTWLVPRF